MQAVQTVKQNFPELVDDVTVSALLRYPEVLKNEDMVEHLYKIVVEQEEY